MNRKALQRLAKLAGMMRSPYEPEADAAREHVRRLLAQHGRSLADLESLLELARPAPAPARFSEAEYAAGMAATAAAYRQRGRRFAIDTDDDEDDEEPSEVSVRAVPKPKPNEEPEVSVTTRDKNSNEEPPEVSFQSGTKPHVDRDAILAETDVPGVTVSEVARRHGITPANLYAWRKRRGFDVAPRKRALVAEPKPLTRSQAAKRRAAKVAARNADQLEERIGFRERVARGEA